MSFLNDLLTFVTAQAHFFKIFENFFVLKKLKKNVLATGYTFLQTFNIFYDVCMKKVNVYVF